MSTTHRSQPQDHWFGTGEAGFIQMFAVWGESEPKNVARVPFRRAHTGTLAGPDGKQALNSAVLEALTAPDRPRRLIDPRELSASQHGVTWSGVNYYLHESRYGRTGWTFADQNTRINREIVVWSSPQQGPVLLSGHHRTTVSLLLGEAIDVVWVDFDGRAVESGMRVTPLVWVGDCPHPHQRVSNARAAEPLVRAGTRCVLPSIDDAKQLLELSAGQQWVDSVITFATSGQLA